MNQSKLSANERRSLQQLAAMTPDEHLDCILAFIDRALQTCAKRTPGEWQEDTAGLFIGGKDEPVARACYIDRLFIANASIGYESALRSTKAAIEELRLIAFVDHGGLGNVVPDESWTGRKAAEALTAIRAAWPIEKLK